MSVRDIDTDFEGLLSLVSIVYKINLVPHICKVVTTHCSSSSIVLRLYSFLERVVSLHA